MFRKSISSRECCREYKPKQKERFKDEDLENNEDESAEVVEAFFKNIIEKMGKDGDDGNLNEENKMASIIGPNKKPRPLFDESTQQLVENYRSKAKKVKKTPFVEFPNVVFNASEKFPMKERKKMLHDPATDFAASIKQYSRDLRNQRRIPDYFSKTTDLTWKKKRNKIEDSLYVQSIEISRKYSPKTDFNLTL